MAAMKYKPKKTGWKVHPEPQPFFRGVYPRCSSCLTRLTKQNTAYTRRCTTCSPSLNNKENK